jgi:hypothetical protein
LAWPLIGALLEGVRLSTLAQVGHCEKVCFYWSAG